MKRPDPFDGFAEAGRAAAGNNVVSASGSLSQRAYACIAGRLIEGSLRPGQKLILRPLAARLGLSPTPVREALLRLVAECALVADDRGSTVVPVMTGSDIREMCEVRADLEARAAERAVRFTQGSDLDPLQKACDETVMALRRGEVPAILNSNIRFHRLVCDVGRSPLIRHALEGLWLRLGPSYAAALSGRIDGVHAGAHPHQLLMAALRAGDLLAARDAALEDVRHSQHVLERLSASA